MAKRTASKSPNKSKSPPKSRDKSAKDAPNKSAKDAPNKSANKSAKESKEISKIELPPSPFTLWRLQQYESHFVKPLKLNIPSDKSDKSDKSKDLLRWKYSSINHFNTEMLFAYGIINDTTNTITVTYKIKDLQSANKEVIYCMGYLGIKNTLTSGKKDKNILPYTDLLEKEDRNSLELSDNLQFFNICCGGSMVSKDGEYRSGLINWNGLQLTLDKNANKTPHEITPKSIFDYIFDYMQAALQERKYAILLEYYFPTDKIKNMYQYEAEIISADKKIQFFCIMWFNFYYSYYFGFISNHLNVIFKNIMLKYKKEDIEFFKSIWKKFDVDTIEEFRYLTNNYISGITTNYNIYNKKKLGQKIIPLNLMEAQNPFNLEYGPWKELLIGRKLSNLVLNRITNGFALTNSWFLIKSSNKGLFDNPSQSERMEKSRVAIKIAEILNQAKIYTYDNINPDIDDESVSAALDNNVLRNNRSFITSWLSNEFKKLHYKIDDSITHSKENIIMSNVALTLITEHVGKTLYDSVFLTKKSAYYKKFVKHIFVKENYNNFVKYMFELCYNLLCINEKLGIIHGDLHLNNITLNALLYKKHVKIEKEQQILFSLDDAHFVFEQNFYDLCLIDFSRAIINPETYEKLKDAEISARYDPVHSQKQFAEKQAHDLVLYLYATKPEYAEYGVKLETAIAHHFSAYFKILTALDLYNLSARLLDFVKSKEVAITYVNRESVELVTRLNKSADYYLTTVLMRAIETRAYDDIHAMEWPIKTIIKDVFADNIVDAPTDVGRVSDVYSFNNDVAYSLTNIDKFPPWIKEKKKLIDGKVIASTKEEAKKHDFSIKRRQLFDKQVIKNYQVVNIIKKRQYEKNI